jgi:hypothetical protein
MSDSTICRARNIVLAVAGYSIGAHIKFIGVWELSGTQNVLNE